MNLTELSGGLEPGETGQSIYQFIVELYPICRSITGTGFRETLERIQNHIPLSTCQVPSGTQVFDWTVPQEWNIRDAYIKNLSGERLVDFQKCNLHVVQYSTPVNRRITFRELEPHLHTLPEHPDWIPYRTSYYNREWGFCLSYNQFLGMKDQEYEICIDSTLGDGHLTYGECFLQGKESEEVLISCHACHPSLCNDNLSGIAVATFLARHLRSFRLRYSYRFLFIPGTIGSITWLCMNERHLPKIKHGLVLTGLGDAGRITYKKSRIGCARIDHTVELVLRQSGEDHEIIDFSPYGYDERQYCSPGFNLPVGCLMRSSYDRYPEYHSSADNLDFVKPEALEDSLQKILSILALIEGDQFYINQNPKCEPQMGKRGIYRQVGGHMGSTLDEMALLWVLNLSDGGHSLLDIAERSKLHFDRILQAANILQSYDLLALKTWEDNPSKGEVL